MLQLNYSLRSIINKYTPSATKKDIQLSSSIQNARKKSLLYRLKNRYNYRVDLLMNNWRTAVNAAEDPHRPRREYLYRLYHRIIEDEHTLSQIRTAKNTVQLSKFSVIQNGNENEKLKELFKTPWFFDYLEYCVDTELHGHSLLEFDHRMNNGLFEKVIVIPREHVRPEYQQVVFQTHQEKGVDYTKGKLSKYLIEIGKQTDLGVLKSIAKAVIRKEYSLTDWSRRNEKYGTPFLVVRTASRDKEEIDAKEEMAANFGNNSYAILDDQDEIDLIESSQALTYQTYKDMISYQDSKISMLVNGQTGTSDEKSYVGAAQVHERILNDYTLSRLTRIEFHINFALIPFLTRHGYPLVGASFKFKDLMQKDSREGSIEVQKKKQAPIVNTALLAYYPKNTEVILSSRPDVDIKELLQESIKRIYNKKAATPDMDAELWRTHLEKLYNSTKLNKADFSGGFSYHVSDVELHNQFKHNLAVFSIFKNHQRQKDIVKALYSEDGKARSWEDFKTIAQKIDSQYYQHWLQAEYQTALATAQMAKKWIAFQSNKHLFPYLEYRTQKDDRVRDSHQLLNNIVLPIDDPFWDTYFPPNGWRCRCTVIQTAGPERKPDRLPSEISIQNNFKNNAGKMGEIFTDKHPYISNTSDNEKKELYRKLGKMSFNSYSIEDYWTEIKQIPGNKLKHFKAHQDALGYDEVKGGYLVIHKKRNVGILKNELFIAKTLKLLGYFVELFDETGNRKSGDAIVSGRFFEFKNILSKRDLSLKLIETFSKVSKKGVRNAAINLNDTYKLSELIKAFKQAAIKYPYISNAIIIHNGKTYELNHKQMIKGSW